MRLFYFLTMLVLSSCTRVPVLDESAVSILVESRIGKNVSWNQGLCDQALAQLLSEELTLDAAVEIALLNNPGMQATLWDLGIAQADLVEGGLLQNPLFSGYVRFPDRHSLHVNTDFSVTQNFLDLLLIPLRKKIAEAELNKTELRVAHAVLELAFEVQVTFYTLQAELTKQKLLGMIAEAADAASQLSKAQQQQGNISALASHRKKVEHVEAQVELSRNTIAIINLREIMSRHLGVSQGWRIAETLPELPAEESSLDCLEALARCQRLDLEEARWDVERYARMFGTKQWWAYTAGAVGVSSEKEPEGERVTGPAFSGAIPIFNYGQADRARLEALYGQSLERLREIELKVCSEVRAARDQLQVNRELVALYQNELSPLQDLIMDESQRYYNAMALGVYELLEAKKQELQLQVDGKMALRDYWISHVELDRAIGRKR